MCYFIHSCRLAIFQTGVEANDWPEARNAAYGEIFVKLWRANIQRWAINYDIISDEIIHTRPKASRPRSRRRVRRAPKWRLIVIMAIAIANENDWLI